MLFCRFVKAFNTPGMSKLMLGHPVTTSHERERFDVGEGVEICPDAGKHFLNILGYPVAGKRATAVNGS
jgi:hypothetical protein